MLSFYYLFPMYRTFLKELGVDSVESEVPLDRVPDGLRLSPTDEPCPGVKIAFYHCKTLLDRGCDALFLPAVVSLSPENYCCPKMMGLPDMIRAGLRLGRKQLVSPVINIKENPRWVRSWVEAAAILGKGDFGAARRAVGRGWTAWLKAKDSMARAKIPIPQMMQDFPGKLGRPCPDRKSSVTGLMAHAYVLYDMFGSGLFEMVSSFGKVVTAEMVPEEAALAEVATIFEGEKLWTFEAHILGASLHLLRKGLVDRMIFVSSFSCGPASIIEHYIEDEAERRGIPFLGLVLDEHASHLGLLTRVETFMDIKHRPSVAGRLTKPAGQEIQTGFVRGPELPPRPGMVTMGNLHIPLKSLFNECGVDVLTPPELSDRVVALGRELAPEFICYPMVALLGQCRELCRAGAGRIAMVMGKGKCRLGWYAQVMEDLIRRAGYEAELVGFDSPFPWKERGTFFLHQAEKVIGKPAARSLIRGASLALEKLVLLERSEEILKELRACEAERGSGDALYREFLRELDEASSIAGSIGAFRRFCEGCAGVPKTRTTAVTVALVGEIYVLNEPFVNKDIERVLGSFEQRVRVRRHLTVMNWLKRHILAIPSSVLREMRVRGAAGQYLGLSVGGHGLESVGESVLAARSGVDGVIHLLPFTCMPEIVAQSILVRVGQDLGIPVLSLVLSEQTGEVGLTTRLEAFVDLVYRKKQLLSRGTAGFSGRIRKGDRFSDGSQRD